MACIGVHVAVIKDDKILLIQREDFEVWGIPGGEVEDGETLGEAGIREVKEETGLNIRLTRLVGLYMKPKWAAKGVNNTTVLFAGEVIGGEINLQTDETLDCRFFAKDELPADVIWWSRQQIEDAFNGVGGSTVRVQDALIPKAMTSRADLYQARDESGLSPAEYFHQMFPEGDEWNEVWAFSA